MSITGIWQGTLDGTNWGQAFLKLTQEGPSASGVAQISDVENRTYNLDVDAVINDSEITMHLTPGSHNVEEYPGTIDGIAKLVGPDQMEGEWKSSIGTYGTFQIERRGPRKLDRESVAAMIAQSEGAFVMMAFGHSKLDVLPEDDVLEAIRRGCEEVSVVAHRCDEIEHSGPVTQLMLDEIRKRRFLICDVTHERPNLYYEVGYAHGLGKEVILTAQNDARIHFDIANYNVIFYSSATELQKRLVKRLKGKMTDEEKEKIN